MATSREADKIVKTGRCQSRPRERGMRGNPHVPCGVGEKPEMRSKAYLSLYHFVQVYWDRSQKKEMRFHYFLGFEEPCMLYEETAAGDKTVWLNRKYEAALMHTGNYKIFNALALEKILVGHGSIILHASYVAYKGKAILFTAPSGTGKSTQAALWEKYKGAEIVNGDRVIIREGRDGYEACGIPVCGSSDICLNRTLPVAAIVYLQQGPDNLVHTMRFTERVKRLVSETTISFFDHDFVEKALEILQQVAAQVPCYYYSCTKDAEAVLELYNTLKEI